MEYSFADRAALWNQLIYKETTTTADAPEFVQIYTFASDAAEVA